ncbi:endolytic transglycosylase MltG [Candidatus Dojkabacteria bacterium]|uniref:Endolytic murein transglycosylase n=1 Tax=Candidatus Dojkabacteria bacterium TaxID=2099670 RepID=A0A5C7JCC7_9BACT|nr:MAG: endolytic transglycosylase MltG [Candidatus Dojkabacteria bacterium]
MKRFYIPVFIIVLLIVVSLIWWKNGTSPANSKDNTAKIFIVEPGQGVKAIAKNLKDEGLIKDQVAFFLLTKQTGLANKIQAGSFRLNPSMSANEIANQLTKGTLDIWVTVPEGQRAGEIADALKKSMPNYEESWAAELEKNEGYLFPDTYLFPKDADIDTIISIMRDNFESKYATLDTSKSNLTKAQIVTLASLIEREARHAEDRPKVSSVINNRLDIGMKLDLDATLQYIRGYDQNQNRWWTTNIGNADKTSNSPYNTYKFAGLPPGPISNPGISALEAAINPAETPYLYYITDKNGVNRYAEDIDGHEANISKYGL